MNKIFLCDIKKHIPRAFTSEQINDIPTLNHEDLLAQTVDTSDTEYIFSSWGMPCLTVEEIKEYLPKLKAVFYAAGTVQSFARAFLQSGVRVFSAWKANAIPVAEFAVAQIILANKGYFQLHDRYKKSHSESFDYAETFCGNYGAPIGLLGAGGIGSYVVKLLEPYRLSVKVFDPFLSEDRAAEMGVEKASLEEIFSTCQTISNHLANNAQTKNMLDYSLFSQMKGNATFINTGRGAQLVMEDLLRAMREKPERTALLDVTDPTEPLPKDSEAWNMPNVFLTPHRAGSTTDEIRRMGEWMFDEHTRVLAGEDTLYEVNLKMLETMA